MTPELRRCANGYVHLRWNSEQWAQWPSDRQPTKEDCFQPDWTWPLVQRWLASQAEPVGGKEE